jgi:hypothetical protein
MIGDYCAAATEIENVIAIFGSHAMLSGYHRNGL